MLSSRTTRTPSLRMIRRVGAVKIELRRERGNLARNRTRVIALEELHSLAVALVAASPARPTSSR
jgi:hypothetical protein